MILSLVELYFIVSEGEFVSQSAVHIEKFIANLEHESNKRKSPHKNKFRV